jgi:hypothetical protein
MFVCETFSEILFDVEWFHHVRRTFGFNEKAHSSIEPSVSGRSERRIQEVHGERSADQAHKTHHWNKPFNLSIDALVFLL